MASSVMQKGWIDAVFVGCDRVAANGDTANKIGTSGVAVLAKEYGIPFYVCAPYSTIDFSIADGSGIVIEEREEKEVTEMWYKKPMAPDGIKIYNPAFDVTPARFITAFVTEKGILPKPIVK
jgi:methylthioribose-1-phosphate isomerase